MKDIKKQLLKTLTIYGASNAKLSKKQEMKLKEYILPYLMDEFNLGGSGPIDIKEMRKFIDGWESNDLNENDFKYYYVNKDSDGSSLWDWI